MEYGQQGETLKPTDAFASDVQALGGLGLIFAVQEAMPLKETSSNFDGCDDPVDDDNLNIHDTEACADFRRDRITTGIALRYFDRADTTGNDDAANRAVTLDQSLNQDALALAAMTVDRVSALNDAAVKRSQYDAIVASIATKSPPKLTAADLAASDADLNRLYREMKFWFGWQLDPAIAQSFQVAERSWLQYRDEMVAEAIAGMPLSRSEEASNAVLAQLTLQRVAAFNRWIDALQHAHGVG